MNREPTALYIFRFLMGFGFFAFMGMLYWSSLLVEEDLKQIQGELHQIKGELLTLRGGRAKGNADLSHFIHHPSPHHVLSSDRENKENEANLLTPDPFYLSTLPKMLGPDFIPHGIRDEATIGKPNHLNPFSNWREISSWISLCSVTLTSQDVGKYETFSPEMALAMELRRNSDGEPEYWLSLRRDVFWAPLHPSHFPDRVELAPMFMEKHQVTAHDFKFFYDALMNPHMGEAGAVALRNYFNDIEEIRVVDDFTLVVRWKTKKMTNALGEEVLQMKYLSKSLTGSLRPLPRFVYQYFADGTKIISDDHHGETYRTNPIWAQNFSHHWANNIIVSCGAWLFDGMTDRVIRFRRNPDFYHPYACLVSGYEVKFRNTSDAILEEFKQGGLDQLTIPPNLLTELDRFLESAPYRKQVEEGVEIKKLSYLDRTYNYIGWNQANPLFKNKKVRQALTLAIDRERIIRQNLNGMGVQTTGPFFPHSPSYDPELKPYPFDPDQAKLLLQEEGWMDTDGDGIIDREINGKQIPFRFTLTYYAKNQVTKAIADYVATALKQIGVTCNLNGVDLADLSAVFEDKSFDAVLLGWALGSPPEDPRQLWYSTGAREKGSSNAIGFSNIEADQIIDQLQYEYDPQKRISLYHRFDKIIYDEAPYTFLYTPKTVLAYRSYLQNVFIPVDRQDLIPGANVGEPIPSLYWIKGKRGD